jgi:hypothetical protein
MQTRADPLGGVGILGALHNIARTIETGRGDAVATLSNRSKFQIRGTAPLHLSATPLSI